MHISRGTFGWLVGWSIVFLGWFWVISTFFSNDLSFYYLNHFKIWLSSPFPATRARGKQPPCSMASACIPWCQPQAEPGHCLAVSWHASPPLYTGKIFHISLQTPNNPAPCNSSSLSTEKEGGIKGEFPICPLAVLPPSLPLDLLSRPPLASTWCPLSHQVLIPGWLCLHDIVLSLSSIHALSLSYHFHRHENAIGIAHHQNENLFDLLFFSSYQSVDSSLHKIHERVDYTCCLLEGHTLACLVRCWAGHPAEPTWGSDL